MGRRVGHGAPVVGDARAFLDSVAHAVSRMAVLRAEMEEIQAGGDPRHGPRVHRPGVSDPTAASALRRMDALADKAKQVADCEDLVGECLVLIANVRAHLGDMYAEVIDRFYMDGETWADIAGDLMVDERTARRYRDKVCEWGDGVGIEWARCHSLAARL